MSVRRLILAATLALVTAVLFFQMGQYSAQRLLARQKAESEARIEALRAELLATLAQYERTPMQAKGTSGADFEGRDELIGEIVRQLQAEMGLMPVRLLRERRESFVELYAYDNTGKTNYGTAGYLGEGYFITVKHGVMVLEDPDREPSGRTIESIKLAFNGRRVSARVVDAGDANVEVHSGDWAILKVKEPVDLPPLRIDANFAFDFAEPIFRLGNDYSKGIILSTGYIGQRTSNGLVTCLTDGHPGVSGGGVLNRAGNLVGIPIGRMQGDYRFSFILPLRKEMFRKVPGLYEKLQVEPAPVPTAEPVPDVEPELTRASVSDNAN
ncbi:MAG TPA: serine protease [Vicinamibacterales bacterium]|nr:serine protease [Vicinamibacterales bacterium]